jgi:hypothetical protein
MTNTPDNNDRHEREWRDISTAPRDGTPVLLQRDPREWPFVAYWGNPYRYFKKGREAWIGHENGLHEDSDGLFWMPLPDLPYRFNQEGK